MQLISAIRAELWKHVIKKTHKNTTDLIVNDYHVIKGLRSFIFRQTNTDQNIFYTNFTSSK